MTWLKRAWAWLTHNLWVLAVAAGAMLGAGVLWQYRKGRILKLEDDVALEQARAKVAALDARRAALAAQSDADQAALDRLAKDRAALKVEAAAIVQRVDRMDGPDLERAFRELYR